MIGLLLLALFGLSAHSWAGQQLNPWTGRPDLCPTIQESDGSPSHVDCTNLSVTNGTMTDANTLDTSGTATTGWTRTGTTVALTNAGDTVNLTATTPTLIGGTGTTSDLFLQTTSGVGAAGADMHFLVGNNGATEALTILNSGNVGIGTTSPGVPLDVVGNIRTSARLAINAVGTIGNPSIFRTDDSNTGIYWPAASQIGIVTAAVERMRFDNAGNVGIGTSTPNSNFPLSVVGNGILFAANNSLVGVSPVAYLDLRFDSLAARTGLFVQVGNGQQPASFRRYQDPGASVFEVASFNVFGGSPGTDGGGAVIGFGYRDTSLGQIGAVRNGANDTGDIVFRPTTAGTANERMRVAANGNVGIGATSPGRRLSVVSSVGVDTASFSDNTNSTFYIAHNLNNVVFLGVGGSTQELRFGDHDGATYAMTIKGTGNVGIGTTSPTNLLSLSGQAAQTFWMERQTTANTAGNSLSVIAGGATAGATDKNGGNLVLAPGTATGTGSAGVLIQSAIAGATGTADRAPATHLKVSDGHLASLGTTPTVGGSCGTGPSIVGTDVAGKVTTGTVAPTSCTVTFATAWVNAPSCVVTNETTANLARATSTTTTVVLAGTFVASDVLAYACIGRE